MTGNDEVVRATLSDTRAQAAIAARRFGVPPTMIEAASRRRTAGDWRGACAAAGVDLHLNPDSVRRRHGAAVAELLLADLRTLAPDLLRWHLPRHGHGPGLLVEGLLVPLAEYPDATGRGVGVTLVAATPRFALDAGERIVLTVLEGRAGRGRGPGADPVVRAVLDSVRLRSIDRHSLLRHRMFWDAAQAPRLADLSAGLCDTATTDDATPAADPITRLQDAGRAAAAWTAAGIDLVDQTSASATRDGRRGPGRWLSTVPAHLPGLAQRIREAVPDTDEAVIRPAGGAIVLRGLKRADGHVSAEVTTGEAARRLPVVPAAAWSRPLDADLLRFGLLRAHELHPLVGDALSPATAARRPQTLTQTQTQTQTQTPEPTLSTVRPGTGPSEWLYRLVPHFASPDASAPETPSLLIRCDTALHRVAQIDGSWQSVDHDDQPARERLLSRLGGRSNPCRQATQYLGTGRHIIDVVESLLEHGRVPEILDLLAEHAGACASPDDLDLPGGGTVGEALASLRENTLRLRMILAGAPPVRDLRLALPLSHSHSRRVRSRKGDPARTPR